MAKQEKQLAKLMKQNENLKRSASLRSVSSAAVKAQSGATTIKREILKTCMSGTMQVLTKSFGTLGPVPLMIDSAIGLAGIATMALTKGATRRFGQDIVISSVNAHVARAIWSNDRFAVWAGKGLDDVKEVVDKVRDIGQERAKRTTVEASAVNE